MSTYEIIFESLQNQINNGLITYELAEEVNDLAYEKYVMESTAAARHNVSGAAKAYEVANKWEGMDKHDEIMLKFCQKRKDIENFDFDF